MRRMIFDVVAMVIISVLLLVSRGSVAWASGSEQARPASADLTDLGLEDLMKVKVYGASKYWQKKSEAPSSVSVITADEIKKYGYRTLADVLRSVRGFIVTYDRTYSYVSVRGFGSTGDWNSRILVLVDGHRMNEIGYDSVYVANESIIDIDLVDRIEVVRGPSSSLYGDNAFFAVINITTKQGPDLQGLEISAEAGSQATYRGRASFGKRFESGNKLLLSATALDSEGDDRMYFPEFDPAISPSPPAANNGIAENLDEEKYRSAFAKYTVEDFTLEGAYVSRTKKVPNALFGAEFNDPRYKYVDNRAFLDLTWKKPVGSGMELLGKLYYDQYWFYADYPYAAAEGIDMNEDYYWGRWWGAEAQAIKTLHDRHTIVVGAGFQDNIKSRFLNYDTGPYWLYIDSNRRSQKWSLFAQEESRLSSRVILNAGVRYDHYETFGSTMNPRAALILRPAETSSLKLLYGTAFRAPNQFELYFDSPTYGQKGNPDLDPEKITTYELVYEQRMGDHVSAMLAGFYNRIRNLIVGELDPGDSLFVFTNHEGARAYGIEAEIEGKWQSGLRNRLSYTYTPVAELTDVHQGMPNSPRNMIKGSAVIPLISQKLFTGLDAQYISRRGLVSGGSTGSVVLVNATFFSRGIAPNLEASASVYNLFDRQYGDAGGGEDYLPLTTIKQDGRTYRVKLTYGF